ncbi:glycine cleavage system H protein GcvH [Thermoanaerobacter kivui]|uniref:Glycine cleavage system H protein GcvH n=1 Tax=Thermoanaerobacter kivui TaxID=2325 RepID=A0A097ATC5_THEKI|nr:putative zinc-binding protein [Thermoanaerobacter kivui]AIS53057.1 glycine cleavage system H protein GcvH [Thermoanaerobacter kivui]
MDKKYVVLPCNGLDKCAGCVSREAALTLKEKISCEIICPVFYRVADARYNKLANENQLIIIDGCNTRCATKLASEKNLKVYKKVNVTEISQQNNITLSKDLKIGENEKKIVEIIIKQLVEEDSQKTLSNLELKFPEVIDYEIYKKDKFIFRLPKTGFYFNENDCWVYADGNLARIGVTDYVQQSLSDIMFFNPPSVGNEISQFDEVGSIESGKAVFEIISPVSGRIVRINEKLLESPEYINENPYEKGWIADIELSNFDSDKMFLLSFDEYFEKMKRKVDEFHV